LKCIIALLRVDKDWIPRGVGYSLYIRPTTISTHAMVGVAPALSSKLFVICSPVGPYYPEGWKPVKLLADPTYTRAWPGGTGGSKLGSNYALGILPQAEAAKKGYSQILWVFGDDLQVTEVGTMNIFFFMINKKGKRELVTAPLDGTILPGVTRDSILALTRHWNEFEVNERKYTLKELMEAAEEGRIIEAFGSGTAAVVSPVKAFAFKDKEYAIPLDKLDPTKMAGKLTQRVADAIVSIQYGQNQFADWSVVVD